jgi:hypothetical protein
MAKAKTRKGPPPEGWYPPIRPLEERGGCKVSWYVYATKEDCEAVKSWVQARAIRRWNDGYDAGYLSPGAISQRGDGKWEIVVL